MVVNLYSEIALYPPLAVLYAASPMRPFSDQSYDRRVTVPEAAALLGITPDAVRSRLRRGTLQRDEAPDGTVLVVLDGDGLDASATDHQTDQPTVSYINALKSHIETLEGEVQAWREEARRKDHLLAAALERIPMLEEAPPEPRDAPEEAPEGRGRGEVPPEQERRSWWRRIFFGAG